MRATEVANIVISIVVLTARPGLLAERELMKAEKKRLRKMGKLTGEVPCVYRRQTIYNMCVMINALVDAVNYLNEELEKLREDKETKIVEG